MGLLGRVIFLLMVLLLSLQAVVYEDAEDGSIERWRVIDNDPTGAEVNNLEIGENRVIHLLGDRTENAFILGGKNTETQYKWHNQDNSKVLSWRMKFDERYYVYVYVETESGEVSRFRYSSSRDNELKRSDIRISLGKESDDGEWVNVTRNIEDDLQLFKPNDTIVAINGFMVIGTGMVDDISFGTSTNPEENQIPVADAGEDKTIVLGDTITLNGTGEDGDGNIIFYSWSYNEQGLYSSESSGLFSYTPSQKGVYTLALSVKDNDGLENTDTMTLTVLEDDENSSSEFITQWRKSSGEDMGNAITVVGSEVTFNEENFFIVGGEQTDTLHYWNNRTDKSLSWKMKFNTRYYLYVYIETDAGTLLKLRYSSSHDNELKRDEIRISLGTNSDDGEWVVVDRNLNDDLHQFKADENILAVHGIALQTSAGGEILDSLMLYNSLEHDTISPEIRLLGDSSISVVEGEVYLDAGAEAYDNEDGNITSKLRINNPVNTDILGTYIITYDVIDSSQNSANQVTRTVNVVKAVTDEESTYYVSLNGNDNNDGKSVKEAFRTIAKAVSLIKEGETVSILGGVYREGIIRLEARENKNGEYITFKNYNNEEVFIKGSMLVTGWEHYQGNIWKLPSKENDSSGLNRKIHYQQVFYGEGLELQKVGYPHYDTYEGDLVWESKGYYVPIQENSDNPFGMSEGTFYVEALDNGEFDLYVWLPDGKSPNDEGIRMEVSDKSYLMNVSNVDNVKIEGITFMHTAAAAMANSGNSYQGGYALRVGINAIVDNCTFAYTDFVGLNLSRGSNKEVNQHQLVRNCKIHHNGAVGISASSKDFLIEKSEFYQNATRPFYQLWHTGAIKCNNHGWGEVKDNYIHNEYSHGVWYDSSFSEEFDDSHPILIHHNYINGIGEENNPLGLRSLSYRGHGIFVEYSSNAKVYNNIVAASRQRGLYLASSWDTVITNNLIIGSGLEQLTLNVRNRTEQVHEITNNIIQNNILYNKSLGAEEDIKLIASDEGQDVSNKLEQNIIYNENGAAYSYDFKGTHWNIEDNMEDVDPKFNKNGLDYSSWNLLEGSPAIDISTVNYDFVTTDYSYGMRDNLIDVGCFEFK